MRIIILLILFVVDISVLKAQTVINGTTVIIPDGAYSVGVSTSGNTLVITNSGIVYVTNLWLVEGWETGMIIGSNNTATLNSVLVTGHGSILTNRGLTVGFRGSYNSLIISNGGRVDNLETKIGFFSSNNSVLVTGGDSQLNNTNYFLLVGHQRSHNSLTISNGGRVNSKQGYIGNYTTSSNNTALVTGVGSLWTNNDLRVGNEGAGNSLVISNGGQVKTYYATHIGYGVSSSNNTVLVTGSGSLLTNGNANIGINIGRSGASNNLTISNGGRVENGSWGYIGFDTSSSNNTALVTGVGSLWTNNVLVVGNNGVGNSLVISNGGSVYAHGIIVGASSSSANNLIRVFGTGSELVVTNFMGTGTYDIRRGTNIQNGGTVRAGNLLVTNTLGSYQFNGGSLITKNTAYSNGTDFILGTNSSFIANGGNHNFQNRLYLGNTGTSNSLTISNGAKVGNSLGLLGFASTSSNNSALVTGTGSQWSNRTDLYVGNSGAANSLTISNGGSVFASNLTIGVNVSSSNNLLTMSGVDSALVVTNATGTGTYDIRRGTNIQNGGTVRTDNLLVTNSQGTYLLNGGTSYVGQATISNGQIFVVGDGVTQVLFRQSLGSATNTFANGITVNTNGIFSFAGTINNQIILNGGTLSGTGTLTTSLTIDNGSIIAPGNSPGNANFASQTWGGGGIYEWEINNFTGTATNNWDFINVSGLLDITATAGSPFSLQVKTLDSFNSPGLAQNWNMNVDQAWKILSAGSINGFASDKFSIDLSSFQNPLGTGGFFISQVGNDLYLNFNHLATVPEPKTYAMLAFGTLLTCLYFRLGLKRNNSTHGA